MQEESAEKELDLAYYLEVMLRRRWIILSCAASALLAAALVTFNTRPLYQATSLIIIEKEKGSNTITYQNGPMVERGNEDYYQTQYKLLKSNSILQKVYDKLALSSVGDFAGKGGLARLDRAITIAPYPRSRLVYIKVNSHSADEAAKIANTLANVFIEENLGNQLFISQDVLSALQNRQATAGSRALFDSLPAVVNNPLLQQMKQEAATIDAELAEMSGRYTPKHPQVVALRARLTNLQSQIRTETDRVIQSLKIDLSGQLVGNNIRLIDPATVPDRPIRPRKLFNLLLGLAAGLLLGFLAALVVEILDQTLRTQEDVENRLGLPFLGLVPYIPAAEKPQSPYASMLLKEQSLTSESIRNIRTMLDFANVGQSGKSFLITSSVQGEGKSYVCANLSVAFAQMGEKVLLIDGDLRRSNVHHLFGLSGARGISDFLAKGRSAGELPALVQNTEVENLQVLVCGHRPPNPAELLNTPRLGALLSWAMENYDRVIVDCPPMFPISDTLLWGRHIPRCMFIVRHGQTRAQLVRTAASRLKSTGIKVLGAVINMSKFGGLYYSHYGSSYYKYNYHYYRKEGAESSETSRDKVA